MVIAFLFDGFAPSRCYVAGCGVFYPKAALCGTKGGLVVLFNELGFGGLVFVFHLFGFGNHFFLYVTWHDFIGGKFFLVNATALCE